MKTITLYRGDFCDNYPFEDTFNNLMVALGIENPETVDEVTIKPESISGIQRG